MKKSLFCLAASCFCTFLFSSCILNWDKMFGSSYAVSERSTHISEVRLSDTTVVSDGKYTALVLTDMHFDPKAPTCLPDFYSWLTAYIAEPNEKPAFCAVLGDITSFGTAPECAAFNTFAQKMSGNSPDGYEIPVFPVLGNHDVYSEGNYGKTVLAEVFPHTSAYRIRTEKTSFYFLDTADGTLGSPQFTDLMKKLSSDSNKKITFTHYPLYDDGTIYYRMLNAAERMKLIGSYAKNNVKFAFCGHTHLRKDVDFGSFTECIVAGFNEKNSFVLLSVDESAGSYSYEHIYL